MCKSNPFCHPKEVTTDVLPSCGMPSHPLHVKPARGGAADARSRPSFAVGQPLVPFLGEFLDVRLRDRRKRGHILAVGAARAVDALVVEDLDRPVAPLITALGEQLLRNAGPDVVEALRQRVNGYN